MIIDENQGSQEEEDQQERFELGTSPAQDAINARLQGILPENIIQGTTQKSDIEKLARFFAELPAPEASKEQFWGFINNAIQYGFHQSINVDIMMLEFENAYLQFYNSTPTWQWTRQHSLFFRNLRTVFYSLLVSSVGTQDHIQNTRTSLNELKISRQYGEYPRKRKSWLGF